MVDWTAHVNVESRPPRSTVLREMDVPGNEVVYSLSETRESWMTDKLCVCCGEEIPPRRLQILPNATTCVNCSSETKKSFRDLPGTATVQHTGGLHEKYLKEEDVD